MRLRPPDPGYLELLRPCGPRVQELALATRAFVLAEAPEASEFVYELYTIANHFSFTERPSDAFVFTTTHANWVNLGFNFGAALPDPEGVLLGEGKQIRHIRISTPADLDVPAVRDLVQSAIAVAERPDGKPPKPQVKVRPRSPGAKIKP